MGRQKGPIESVSWSNVVTGRESVSSQDSEGLGRFQRQAAVDSAPQGPSEIAAGT